MGVLSSFRRGFQGGTDSYRDFIDQRNDWIDSLGLPPPLIEYEGNPMDGQRTIYHYTPEMQAQLAAAGPASYEGWDGGQVINWDYANLERQFQQQISQMENQRQAEVINLQEQWFNTLDPATAEKARFEFQQHSDDMDVTGKYGKIAALGIIGAAGGGALGAALGGTGAAGSTALTGVDAAMADLAASGGLTAGDFAAGAAAGLGETAGTLQQFLNAGYTAAEAQAAVQAGALAPGVGAQSVAITAPAITGATGTGAGLVGAAAGTGAAALTSGANMPTDATTAQNQEMRDLFEKNPSPSYWDQLMQKAGSMSATDWVKAGLGTASMYNSLRGMFEGSPDAPNFSQLQEQDLLANRPNQENAYGDTSTWTKNPDGSWSQKTAFGATNQGLYDTASSLKGGLLEQAKNTAPLSKAGLPELGGIVMDPQGNNDAITQAWLARMRPELDRGREAEMQRLANMGVTENRYGGENQAFGNAMDVLNRKDVDATNQALIYGTDAYNKSFQNSLGADQANRQNYQTEFSTDQTIANNPYYQLNQVQGAIPGSPTFTPGGSAANATNAGSLDYKAQMDATNARLAQYEQNAKGLWDLYKGIGG